ncbi:MAG TPA: copper resistance CopC family protein, partial [Actinomycetota bacterium]|nr:copper resistance CopC family protein [Actinomycetota bacterium]
MIQQRRSPDVILTFAEPVSAETVQLWLERVGSGARIALKPKATGHSVTAPLPAVDAGVYEIGYRVLGPDGHPVSGSYRHAFWPQGAPPPPGLDGLNEPLSSEAATPAGRPIALTASLPLVGLALAALILGRGAVLPGR